MSLRWGIVGLPNAGKSTLFNALSHAQIPVGNYPFTTIDPHVGVVSVPDPRLDFLVSKFSPAKVTPALLTFVDIAGLVRGAHEGEGLGNQFLSEIRAVDGIVMVLRLFQNPDVSHVEGEVDPERDKAVLESELLLADLGWLEKQLEKTKKIAKSGDKKNLEQLELETSLYHWIDSGKPARAWRGPQGEISNQVYPELLTAKKILYALNLDEETIGRPLAEGVQRWIERERYVVPLCAKLETELSQLSSEEQTLWLRETGMERSRLQDLIVMGYRLVGAITFFTAGPKEVRAWTILEGMTAAQAGGVIHTDFEKGFVKAEIMAYNDFVKAGSELEARQRGCIRFEGREYRVRDGDIIHFRFTS
ncbi:MAG: redox-regulated ATPase YchF [Deltaproteobacteria bacterium]|nr:redox-regulated ATPase YchF [Deltaproteobacteria bacterium]